MAGRVCAEQEDLLRELGQQAAKPTPEVGLLRQQIEQLHSRHRTELALVQHEKLQLQQHLEAEVSTYHSVQCEILTCSLYQPFYCITSTETVT